MKECGSSPLLKSKSVTYQQCWNYLQSASYESALDKSIHLIQREPQEPDGYIFKARALFNLKRYRESEQALMKVVSLSQSNNRLKSDVNGMIKLKDELANVRVEILRSHKFRDAHDIAQMHWNDCSASIVELIGFSSISKNRIDQTLTKDSPMEAEIEIIAVKPPESEYVYPEVSRISSSSMVKDTGNLSRSAAFPVRDSNQIRNNIKMEESLNKSYNESDLETAGLKTSLVLAEEKVKKLEEELRRVYTRVLTQNKEMEKLRKAENQLREDVSVARTQAENNIKKYNDLVRQLSGDGVVVGSGDIIRSPIRSPIRSQPRANINPSQRSNINLNPRRIIIGNTGEVALRLKPNPISPRVATAGNGEPFRYRSSVNPVTKRLRVLRIARAPRLR